MHGSAGLVVALLLSGCLDGRYVCASSTECVLDGQPGVCEPTGFCSFADPTCAPIDRRYGAFADAAHRGRCVGEDAASGCVRDLASGGAHDCVVGRDGSIWCWGANQAGQLGNGSFAGAATPARVIDEVGRGFGDVVEVAAGLDFTCARRTDQTLWCWGNGRRLGAGDVPDVSHPRQVRTADGPLEVVQVSAGATHACAVRADRTIWCWGADDAGQLGDGGTTEQLTATQVRRGDGEAFDGAVRVAAGAQFTCAARPDNVWCWGDNAFAQLGQPGGPPSSPAPSVALPVATDALAAGGAHACAVEAGGAAWCWGRAEDGQIGEPGLPGVGVAPVRVWSGDRTPLRAATSVAAGNVHSCASTRDGRVACWGTGVDGQLGHGVHAGAETAVEVRTAAAALADVVEVTAGVDGYQGSAGRHSCARQADAVWCWGALSDAASGDDPGQRSPLAVPVELSAVCP